MSSVEKSAPNPLIAPEKPGPKALPRLGGPAAAVRRFGPGLGGGGVREPSIQHPGKSWRNPWKIEVLIGKSQENMGRYGENPAESTIKSRR